MDRARGWQVASAVTAVAGLGLGGFALDRPSVEPAAPIELDVSATGDAVPRVVPIETPGTGLTFVTPALVEDDPETSAITVTTPATPQSISTPDEPSRERDRSGADRAGRSDGAGTPDVPDSVASPDEPEVRATTNSSSPPRPSTRTDSVASTSEAESPDSVDSGDSPDD